MIRKPFLLTAALIAAGCAPTAPTPPPPPNIVLSCIGNSCNVGPTGTASPAPGGPASGCAIASVGNSLHGTSEQGGIRAATLAVNETRTLDTTPKGPDGRVLADNCPIAPVSWSISQAVASCSLNSSSVYTPVLKALREGTCELRATVGTVTASEPIVITVRAAGSLWSPPTLDELLSPPRWEHTQAGAR